MSFFQKIFKKKQVRTKSSKTNNFFNDLVSKATAEIKEKVDRSLFLSKKEYLEILEKHSDLYKELKTMKDSGMLSEYCDKKSINPADVEKLLAFYVDDSIRNSHNDAYTIKEINDNKEYFAHILEAFDPNVRLDNDQLKVVVREEDNTLVVAGAGAGKTTTVAAKVKYLVDKRKISPDEILVISFTNKAVDELKERINKKLKIACDISTFHSIGSSIIYKNEERKTIKEEQFLFSSIRDYLRGKILVDKTMTNKILLFFASYLDLPPRFDMPLDEFFAYVSKKDFITMRSELQDRAKTIAEKRDEKNKTICDETVASYQEMQIANFLYINGIDYVYEDPYKFPIEGSHKIYTPDFHLIQGNRDAYLEHFGMVSDKGINNSRSQTEIDRYIKAIRDKVALHEEHHTKLLKTFGAYSDGRDIIYHLEKELVKYGFELHKKSEEEIFKTILTSESNKYINRMVFFIKDFISAYKTNGYGPGYFKTLRSKTKNERDKVFLDICEGAYNNYQNDLRINHAIDFSDMINDSVQIIKEMQENHESLKYKYIIVDEYQDISHQRYNLTKELSKICDAKIVAVGDDWQSIYAFSGSDITLFTEFKKNVKNDRLGCEQLYINNTYRNAQELINIAGRFILKNNTQYVKQLKSPKNLEDPVIIYSYCDDKKKIKEQDLKNATYQKANALQIILDRLVYENPEILNREKGKEPILLIGRYNFDAERLSVGRDKTPDYDNMTEEEREAYNLFDYNETEKRLICKKYPTLRLAFMTAHSSKGLTYDNVIIINGMNDLWGFPSKKEDDPIMDLVIKRDNSVEYAEERRLFYVALTRTSNRVFILAPETKPSEFVSELILDKGYKNVVVKGVFNETLKKDHVYYCPDCGFPLKRINGNSIGIHLYVCTNEHELCGFMTNDIKGGRLRVLKCSCLDGYLIVKKKTEENSFFLGCTNYKSDGTGCNETMSIQQFNQLYPAGEIKKRTPEEVNNRTGLKYKGEEKEIIDTSKAIEKAKILKKEEKVAEENAKVKQAENNLSLISDICKYCEKYSDYIRLFNGDDKKAFIKNEKSWHWFWVDCKKIAFCYHFVHKDELKIIPLNSDTVKRIYEVIDDLIANYYSATPKSLKKDIGNPSESEEKKPEKLKKQIIIDSSVSSFIGKRIEDTQLFQDLKEWRMAKANELNVFAFVVLTDNAIAQVVINLPKTMDELMKLRGFGKNNCAQYGEQILEIVKRYL